MTDSAAALLARSGRRLVSSWVAFAVLAVSLAVHVLVMAHGQDGLAMIDLRVYVTAPDHLRDASLYDYVTTGDQLPFTYPPFAALVFWPLAQLPWPVVAVSWQVLNVLLVAAAVYLTLRLLGRAGTKAHRAASPLAAAPGIVSLATGCALWLEPVRTTFNYGQINLVLMVLLLAGAVSTKQWIAGTSVGLTAGIKLIPAITGLYYLLARRFTAVLAAVVSFAVTVAICLAVMYSPTKHYFTELIFDPGRTGVVSAVRNQSLRGALLRLGLGAGWLLLLLVVVALALGVAATILSLRAGDRTAAFLAVQFTGLLVSPISWNHHWVWVLPLLLWCLFGRAAGAPLCRLLGPVWVLATVTFAILFVAAREKLAGQQGRTLYSWEQLLSALYPVLGLLTLLAL
ncbi:MAG: glycosyltransferase 87 family protein, partial [Nakamurella sp.]